MDLTNDIEQTDLIVLDLETTGLDPAKESICEIGALKIRERKIIATFHSLVNPGKPIPQEVYFIHKISDNDVKGAPRFCELAAELSEFLRGSVFCAYNCDFDLGFLTSEAKRIDYPWPEVPTIDILTLARKTITVPKYKLGAVAKFFNIAYQTSAHRALEDASIAAQVLFKLTDLLKGKGITTLSDFLEFTMNKGKNLVK